MNTQAQTIRLLVRADDAGSSSSANQAILEACQHGLVRNVSVMVPGPAFADVPKILAALPEICLGFHVTLNSEWRDPKWGPILPPEQIPSIVNSEGYFYPSVAELRNAKLDEMVAEIQAQLDYAQTQGLKFAYLDEHMGVGEIPGLAEALSVLAQREGLICSRDLSLLPLSLGSDQNDPLEDLLERLSVLRPATYLLITHPACDDDEMRRVWNDDHKPGEVARQRDSDRKLLSDRRLIKAFHARGIEILRYDQLTVVP